MSKWSHFKANRRGFTLIEVMFAVFFGAWILVMGTSFVFSMGMVWGQGAEVWLFQKHVRGVSRFLQQSIDSAGMRVSSDQTETPVYWLQRGGQTYGTEQFLTFDLARSPGVLVWEEEPLPHVVCSLHYDREDGLSLLWRSRLEAEFEEKDPRKTRISPFVKDFRYWYLDPEDEEAEWEVEEEPRKEANGDYVNPQRLELVFFHEGEEIRRFLVLPTAFQGVPVF